MLKRKEVKLFFFLGHLLFWGLFLGLILRPSGPLFPIYSIKHFEKNYYQFDYQNGQIKYSEINTIPDNWIAYNRIPKKVWSAFVVSEDGKFFKHNGFDLEQLQKVITEKFFYKKKKNRGASTITQQLIKNLYLTKDKSISRKAKELYLATYLEKNTSKEKILEVYLNIIEFGEGLYGIENASKYYFNKSVEKIGAKEAAFLAMLLPAPKRYSKSFKQKFLSEFAVTTVNNILLKMRQNGYIGEEELYSEQLRKMSFEKVTPPYLKTIESEELADGESEDENA